MIEFALIAPLLVLLVFGTIDYSNAYSEQLDVRSTAREGARLAIVNGGDTTTDLINAISGRVQDLDKTKIKVSVQLQDVDGDGLAGEVGETVSVCIRYPRTSVSGFFAPVLNGTDLKSAVVMRMEQQAKFASGTSANWPAGAPCP